MYTLQMTCLLRTLAWNLTRSPHSAQSTLLPASTSRTTARLLSFFAPARAVPAFVVAALAVGVFGAVGLVAAVEPVELEVFVAMGK